MGILKIILLILVLILLILTIQFRLVLFRKDSRSIALILFRRLFIEFFYRDKTFFVATPYRIWYVKEFKK